MKRMPRLTVLILFNVLVMMLSGCVSPALYKKTIREDPEELEWIELLDTKRAFISVPASANLMYGIHNRRYYHSGIFGMYNSSHNNIVTDDIKGYDIYDASGAINPDYIVFDYKPPRRQRENKLIYADYFLADWKFSGLTEEERKGVHLMFILPDEAAKEDRLEGGVKVYTATIGDIEYNVAESVYRGAKRNKRKRYINKVFYRSSPDFSLLHYFWQESRIDNKCADDAEAMFRDIISAAVISDEMDEDMQLKYILHSARELQIHANLDIEDEKKKEEKEEKKKDETSHVTVEYMDTGAQEEIDIKREKILEDFSRLREVVFNSIDDMLSKRPDEPKLYFAKGVLSEYNASGERYGKGYDKDKAIGFYQQAIEGDKNFHYAHYNIAMIYVKEGDRETAITHFKDCIAVSPINLLSMYMIAKLYEEQEDYDNTYRYYWKTDKTMTAHEKNYCPKFYKKIWSKLREIKKLSDIEMVEESRHRVVEKSTMAAQYYVNPELLLRFIEDNYSRMGRNVFSFDEPYLFWHGYLREVKKRDRVTAKWYSPDGKLYKEDDTVERVGGEIAGNSFYFLIPVAKSKLSRMPGLWKIEVFFEDELIDTKHFYILDC